MADEAKTPAELMAEALKALPWRRPANWLRRLPATEVVDWLRVVNTPFIAGLSLPPADFSPKPGSVTYVNWATPPSKTAKNKRRARARQRAREVRRSAGGNSPAATALPTPAPARSALTAGEPAPGAADLFALMAKNLSDESAGLVPLPEKPKPVEHPFVPRKIGEF